MKRLNPFVIVMLVITMLVQSGCLVMRHEIYPLPVDQVPSDTLSAALRVHTIEGEVIFFSPGVYVGADALYGNGTLYGLNPELQTAHINKFPRDSVAFMVAEDIKRDFVSSTILTSLTALGIGATVTLFAFALAWSNSCVYGSCD